MSDSLLEAILDWEKLRKGESISAMQVRKIYRYMTSDRGVARSYKTLKSTFDEERLTLQDLLASYGLLTTAIWHEAFDKISDKICSANVYIDSFSISDALNQGAQIVLAGRVSDPGLAVGPCIYEFGWNNNDYKKKEKITKDVFYKFYRILKPGGSVWISDLIAHSLPQIHSMMWKRYGMYLKNFSLLVLC